MSVQPIPEGAQTIIPHLVVQGAADAIEFYKKAFGAEELRRMPTPDGSMIMHAELAIGDSQIYLCDEMPGIGGCQSPKSLGGTSTTVHIWSTDADKVFAKAIAAGATVELELMDAFWGDRYGKLKDPFGHLWGVATHVADLSPQEIMQAAIAQFGGG